MGAVERLRWDLAIQNGKWVEADTGAVTAGGDLDMSGYDLTVDFSTIEAAGEHAEENDANATANVTIQATDPTVLRRTLTGDVTLLVAGAPTLGKGWSTELRTTQDGTGGRDLTILPANLLRAIDRDAVQAHERHRHRRCRTPSSFYGT
jgi:hypothetical protein